MIRFSRDVAPGFGHLIEVRGPGGAALEVTRQISGRVVRVSPVTTAGWPAESTLEVRVRRGEARVFRSADGSALDRDFAHRVAIGSHHRNLGDLPMALAPADGLDVGVQKGAVLSYRFTLPIAPSSVEGNPGAVKLQYREGGRVRVADPPDLIVDPTDARILHVRPWRIDSDFAVGREHTLIFLPGRLRSVTGETLASGVRRTFMAANRDDFEGHVDFSFLMEGLDREANPLLPRLTGWARPIAAPSDPVLADDARGYVTTWEALPRVWSDGPSRLQLLIPGEFLGDQPGLVTGFSWLSRRIAEPVLFPQLLFTLGHAATTFGTHFADNFDDTLGGTALQTTVALGSVSGEWTAEPSSRIDWVDIELQDPFLYLGGRRDVVIDVWNGRGGFSAGGFGPGGLVWGGRIESRGRPRTLFSAGDETTGDLSNVVFASKIHIERHIEIVSNWEAAIVGRPVWYALPTTEDLRADGKEGRDFRFEFQGELQDGSTTDWTRLGRLTGCRKIRAKLVFMSNLHRTVDAAEVRRLRVRYREAD